MNPFQVRGLVGRLEAAFPDPPLADATGALYEQMLADLGYDDSDAAIDALIAGTARLPPIGRIRRRGDGATAGPAERRGRSPSRAAAGCTGWLSRGAAPRRRVPSARRRIRS